jgi:hypothetical protein
MHDKAPPELNREQLTAADMGGPAALFLGAAGIVCLAVGWTLGAVRNDGLRYFYHAYLVNYCFYLSIALGSLFFVALHHVTRAGWSVAVRRLAEFLAADMVLLAVLFLPILVPMLFGNQSLYPWTDPAVVSRSEPLQHKASYLNVPFFAVRCALYFAFWWAMSRFFFIRSLKQDQSGDPRLTTQMERVSGPALLLFALTVTFASFDWLMSLQPTWFSTIFGVYFFSGAAVGALGAIILAAVALRSIGRLTSAMTAEHYHDLGKLLLGFVIFWGYIAFSQWMLIWYANLPEETNWYLPRQTGPWFWVSAALWIGNLALPFFGLLSRRVKRRPALLAFWAAWLLAFHWLDLYWLVMPNVSVDSLPLGPLDLALLAGLGCLYLAGVLHTIGHHALIPIQDPRLAESLAFENV